MGWTILRVCFVSVAVFVVLISLVEDSYCGRGRGGGGGIRLSSSRSRTSSIGRTRNTNTRINVRVSSHSRRPWGSGYQYRSWHSYGSAGYIYGYVYYTRSRRYHRDPDHEPQICYNEYDYMDDNGTAYKLFICPGAHQSEDYNYCCGDEDRQSCCRFWDSGSRLFGVIAGIVIFIGMIGLCMYCCCFRRPQPTAEPFFQSRVWSRRQRSQNVQYTVAQTGPPTVVINTGPTVAYPPGEQQPLYPAAPAAGDSKFYPPNAAAYPPYNPGTEGGFVPTNDPSYPQAAPDSVPAYQPYGHQAADNSGYPSSAVSPPPPYPASPSYPPSGTYPPPSGGYPPTNSGGYQSAPYPSPSAPPMTSGAPTYSASPAPPYPQ